MEESAKKTDGKDDSWALENYLLLRCTRKTLSLGLDMYKLI